MSMEFTARTPLPYRLVRPWVSTIAVVFSMTPRLGSPARHVVSRKTDLWSHPWGRPPAAALDSARLTSHAPLNRLDSARVTSHARFERGVEMARCHSMLE